MSQPSTSLFLYDFDDISCFVSFIKFSFDILP